MNESVERALQNHKTGYNCAQAVLCAYCDRVGLDEDTAYRLSEPMGGGVGGTQEGICGAVSALFALAGLRGSGGLEDRTTRQDTYALTQELGKAFMEKNGSLICKDLKGKGMPGVFRSCTGCIEDASIMAEALLSDD